MTNESIRVTTGPRTEATVPRMEPVSWRRFEKKIQVIVLALLFSAAVILALIDILLIIYAPDQMANDKFTIIKTIFPLLLTPAAYVLGMEGRSA